MVYITMYVTLLFAQFMCVLCAKNVINVGGFKMAHTLSVELGTV